jgi:O-antigen/teichoic acid export membrane protein
MILPRVWSLLALSFKFAILQFASVFMYNATTLVVTAKISLTDGAELNLVQKLYTFIIAIYLSLYNPLWAGYSDAIYRNDWDWSRKTLTRTIIATTVLFVTALFVFSFSGNFFLNLLAGKGYISQLSLFIFMGLWALFYCLYSMGVAFISATGKINLITALTALGAMFFVSIALYFSERWGIIGISVWSALSFFLLGCVAYYHAFFIIRKAKNKLAAPELV